ncbi:MAG: class II fructose-bisphosphate aldolase [Candidatus Buchananbacteria bacterium]|jgi:fructose-bisphosphate aldolase class II
MIVHIKSILAKADKGKFGVGAFNTSNLEVTLGIVRAAKKTKSPVIVQISESTIHYAGLNNIVAIIKSIAETDGKDVPIAIHLDHGKDWDLVKQCVMGGLSSVHMDASAFGFEENISLTKRAAIFAHQHGVYCQGELGSLLGKEGMTLKDMPKNHDEYMTDPAKVKEFVKRTGIDTLAISVGAMHGFFPGQEKVDFPRLEKIHQAVPNMPLVLHGASGLPDSHVIKAITQGVRIINIDTDLRIAFTETLKSTIKVSKKTMYDPRKILAPSIDAVADQTEKIIRLTGSGRR